MAKQTLPTNFKDDVLNTSMSGKRKWNISQNADGTYSITDVTTYDQVGSEFGAGELNATNQAVNASADAGKIIDDPDTAEATTEEGYIAGVQLFNHVNESLGGLRFGTDGDGNYGYYGADDSLIPFKSGNPLTYAGCQALSTTSAKTYTCGFEPNYAVIVQQYRDSAFMSIFVDFEAQKVTRYYQTYNSSASVVDLSAYINCYKKTSNGVSLLAIDSDYASYATVFLA